MKIRHAQEKDMEQINDLLCQVLTIHYTGRPDLFKKDTKKYTDAELLELICDDTRPIFVGWTSKNKWLDMRSVPFNSI